MGGGRGRLTSLPKRKQYIDWIQAAHKSGARLNLACREVGISLRTYRRWCKGGHISADKRPDAVRLAPKNKLTEAAIVAVCNQPRFASLPPTQIVPTLLDEGDYYSSESTFYRVLKQHKQLSHRGRALAPQVPKAPKTFTATGRNGAFPKLCVTAIYLTSILTQNLGWSLKLLSRKTLCQ